MNITTFALDSIRIQSYSIKYNLIRTLDPLINTIFLDKRIKNRINLEYLNIKYVLLDMFIAKINIFVYIYCDCDVSHK